MSANAPQQDVTTPIAAGVSAAAILTGPGRLRRITVTGAGTASTTFFDNPSAASGTVLFVTKAAPAIGDVYDVNMPAALGIWAVGITGSAALTVST